MQLIEALNWRYAVKRMNGEKVPRQKVENILEAIRLSASSMGLQPYTILVIEDESLRKKLSPAVNNQPQILEGSHVLIFSVWNEITENHINDYIENVSKTRGVSVESLVNFKKSLMRIVTGKTDGEKFEWAARQAYIALGTGLAAAALEKVDATPMEGFNSGEVDRILNLKGMGLRSVALLTLGFRDEKNDLYLKAKKVRRSMDELILNLN